MSLASQLLVEAEGFHWAGKVTQLSNAVVPSLTWVTHEVIGAVFSTDDKKVGEASRVTDANDHWISEKEIPIDEKK